MRRNTPAGLTIAAIDPSGAAAWAGLQSGDMVLRVNGHEVADELDVRFYSSDSDAVFEIMRNNEMMSVTLETGEGPLGIEFADLLADGVHTCSNHCVFCFVHQMPKRMRRSLYLMDDDYRLSFVHGNYITLTNLSTAEFDRIIEQRLSPLYVSVHATDPEIRGRLLGQRTDTPILPPLQRLAESRIDVHAQIVLCPGLNDGVILDRTLDNLTALHPAVSGLRSGVHSVAIVPVGITRYRDRLSEITPPTQGYSRTLIKDMRRKGAMMEKTLGTRFAWLSDEWYYIAQKEVPGLRHYEGFPQLEDGVGTTRLFIEEIKRLKRRLPDKAPQTVSGTVVTGALAAASVDRLVQALNEVEGVDLSLMTVPNHWFGGTISATGLLTADDIARNAKEIDAPPPLWIPDVCLRHGERVFLDDVTPDDLASRTGYGIHIVPNNPVGFASVLGLT